MSAGRMRRVGSLLGLVGCLSGPVIGLGWASPASAAGTVEISISSSANPSAPGQDVTYTATLTTSDLGPLTGPMDTMEFEDNGTDITGCSLQALSSSGTGIYTASCDEPASSLSIGPHAITATFSGDSSYPPATGSLPIQTVTQAMTTTTLTSPMAGG